MLGFERKRTNPHEKYDHPMEMMQMMMEMMMQRLPNSPSAR